MNQYIRREQGGMCLMSETTAKHGHGEREVPEKGARGLRIENMTGQAAALWSYLIESRPLMRSKKIEYGESERCGSRFLDSRTLRS